MTFRLGRITLRVHGMLPLLWIFAWITGSGAGLLPTLLALLLHESGHLLAARWQKMRVEEIEITPYGGVIVLENVAAAPPLASFFLAAAGPLASLMGCFLAAALLHLGMMDDQFAQGFARGNLLLLLVNLIPALPLDGGRMMRALLSRFLPYATATRILTRIGYGLGALLCGISLYFAFQGLLILSPAFAGLYLIYAATLEGRQGAARYITALIARRQRLERQETLPVELIAVGAETSGRALLRRLSPGKYHVIYVLSQDGMQRLGTLEEKAFCEAVLNHGDVPLGEWIEKMAKRQT